MLVNCQIGNFVCASSDDIAAVAFLFARLADGKHCHELKILHLLAEEAACLVIT